MVRLRAGLVAPAALTVAAAVGWWSASEPAVYPATVIEVVDGDTIVVRYDGGRTETVRILGVDTPETKHPTTGVECFGPEASSYTAARLGGARVGIEPDVEPFDDYGRRLAHVRVDGHSYADELLRLGMAEVFSLPPNDSRARAQLAIELDARARGVGLWTACR
jgi:micrococcal nuclease